MALAPLELDVRVLGEGPRVVFVHGSILGTRTWARQEELADRYTLVLPSRPGFGASPPLERGDFEAEAPLFAALLGDGEGAHLVGHSYGAVIALYAAALAPRSVRSLTISEPGCLAVAADEPVVAEWIANGNLLFQRAAEMTPIDFLRLFRAGAGSARATLDGELLQGAELAMRERPSWEADPPFAALAAAPFPKLVISGAHSPVFEAVCDSVAERTGAERATVSGAGHSVTATGAPYNELLDGFLTRSELARA